MVESDGHYGTPPITNTPPVANGAHGAMREVPAIQQQIDRFLRPDGVVQSFCDGACDRAEAAVAADEPVVSAWMK